MLAVMILNLISMRASVYGAARLLQGPFHPVQLGPPPGLRAGREGGSPSPSRDVQASPGVRASPSRGCLQEMLGAG